MRTQQGRQLRRGRWLHRGAAAVAIMVGSLAAVACAGSAGKGSRTNTSEVTQVVSDEEVALLPTMTGAGDGGWCLTRLAASVSDCPTLHLPAVLGPFLGPIIVEHWSGHGSSVEAPVNEVMVLTTSDVAAVSLEGYAPVATHASPLLPDHLRGVIIELRGGSGEHVFGIPAPLPFPRSHIVALNVKGEPIPQTRAPGIPLEFRVLSRKWDRSRRAPRGVCSLEAKGFGGLVFEGGSIMTAARPHPDVRGREFVDCLRANYLLDNWPLEVNILLDAAHPGSTPAPLPGMRPLARHPGVFQWPGVEGETVARRIAGAWLLVAKGKGLKQRLTFIEHVHATVRL